MQLMTMSSRRRVASYNQRPSLAHCGGGCDCRQAHDATHVDESFAFSPARLPHGSLDRACVLLRAKLWDLSCTRARRIDIGVIDDHVGGGATRFEDLLVGQVPPWREGDTGWKFQSSNADDVKNCVY